MSKTNLVNKIKPLESSVEDTKYKEIEPTLNEFEEKYRKLIEIANDTFLIADVDTGIILEANKNAEALFGIPVKEIVGKDFTPLFPLKEEERIKGLFKKYTQVDKAITLEDIFIQHKNGHKIPVEISTSVFELHGRKVILGIFRDITERKQAEKKIEGLNKSLEQRVVERTEELQKSKDMLTNAQRIANLGCWEWNIVDNTEVWSDEQFRIFGYEPGDIEPTYDHFLKALHPHDYERVVTAIKEALECSAQYKIEFRIIRPDGTERNIAAHGNVYLDTFGKPVKMLGTVLDITKIKTTDKALYESEERYRLLVEGARIIGWEYNPYEDRFTFVSGKAQEITGYTIEQWGEKGFWTSHIHHEDKDFAVRYCKNATKKGEDHEFEYRMITADGGFVWLRDIVQVVLNNDKVAKLRGIFVDIAERKKAEKILQEQKEALEQKNTALNEILGQIEIEKEQIKDNVIANAETLLLPIIEKLRLTGESRKYAQLLQKNLHELTSSLGARLSDKKLRLTSREIDICNMIKNGLISKEIAGLLNISLQTIEKHRAHIRKKLGIVNRKLNLSSILKTI